MLDIDSLSKRYGDVVALDSCSFTVRPGRMLGFLGRNGAGKTTTMRAVFGLANPDSGEIRWDGHPITAADRRRFGYMPEERGLYPKMSLTDQLVYFGRLHGMTADEAKAAADRWLGDLDLGDRAGDPLEDLSQGNQQRVQLAAALLHDPELLVLDEPFNGLDPIGAATMARVLRERAAAGTAVMFSSHQLEVVEDLCEDVAIIDRGRVVVTGEVRALQTESPYRRVELDLSEAQAAALQDLDGVIESRFDGRHHVLKVRADVDVTRLMTGVGTGLGGGQHFVYTTPSLTQIFTEAVSPPDAPESSTAPASSNHVTIGGTR
ncbi:ABC transporter ATP-binding protein [Euzebya pacifica]|nr:ATP-binding cassette domain-containing protein [Euzebya pacifica]